MRNNPEAHRLEEFRIAGVPWKKWGPYLSDRQWGTVREDYSQDGNAWDYFTHDQARSRAYRWGEDGLAGLSDDKQLLCFALALWNGRDPILKERLFGLTNSEGNHGEDVKEYYFYLDNTPTHSYMKYLYKYPQSAFPYSDLVQMNRRRTRADYEYELLDTGVFDSDRYFDVFVEYAKNTPEDILIQVSVCNRGPEAATIHILPTLWFRNTWIGIRALSRYHEGHPYVLTVGGQEYRVNYLPGESDSGMFGGNSNWRGPVWMPVNALLIRALLSFYLYYGDNFQIECPTRSGKLMNLFEVAREIANRLISIFLRDASGRRPVYGGTQKFQTDPLWKDYLLFYEYFHGDNGAGLGASHQTGWTGIVAKLIELFGRLDAEQLLAAGKGGVVISGKAPEERHANIAGLFRS